MVRKSTVSGVESMRNHISMKALGDKNYKTVEFDSGFFKDGGLITGSTQKIRFAKTKGNGLPDFYSGLKID